MTCRLHLYDCDDDVCSFDGKPSMGEADEAALLGLLNSAPRRLWQSHTDPLTGQLRRPWSTCEFNVVGWTVGVFFDGVDVGDWDYIEFVVAPDGTRYEFEPMLEDARCPLLPRSIIEWCP